MDVVAGPGAAELARDVSQTVFYSLGIIALVLGGPLALRRIFFERPYEQSWDHLVQECRIRRYEGEGHRYVYSSQIRVRNRSKSWQEPTRFWASLVFPDEQHFLMPGVFSIQNADRAEQFFNSAGDPLDDAAVGPDESFTIGEVVHGSEFFDVVRVFYCFEVRKRRLFLPGFHKSLSYHASSELVPVNMLDIEHYAGDAETAGSG